MKSESFSRLTAGRTIAFFLVTLATGSCLEAQPFFTPKTQMWRPDGPVYAISCSSGRAYVGGAFSYVGPPSGPAGLIAQDDGQVAPGFPVINGSISVMVPDGTGGWFFGGSFTKVGAVTRNNLVHVLSDLSVDLKWSPQPNDSCTALAVAGTKLYLGGAFSRVAGQVRNRLACVDLASGELTDWNPNASSTISAIGASRTTVYVAGAFVSVGGQGRNRIAAVDAQSGKALAWNPNANNTVNALITVSNRVYVGGLFTTIGGKPRNRIAVLDANTGTAGDWNPNANGAVQTLVAEGGTIYTGGAFTSIGGLNRNHLAALDNASGAALDWNPGVDGTVYAVALSGTNLYAGGDFTVVAQQSRIGLAALDTATGNVLDWNPLLSNFTPTPKPAVYGLAVGGEFVAAGGSFASVGGVVRQHLAALDTASGVVLEWNPAPNALVTALAVTSNRVYVGGTFTNIAGLERSQIAALNPETGQAEDWDPRVAGKNASVLAFALGQDVLYVGGTFTNIGRKAHTSLAALDLVRGGSLDWDPRVLAAGNVPGTVNALDVANDVLYVGGDFTTVDGQARQRLAALRSTANVPLPWNPGANAAVTSLSVRSNLCYIGGAFTTTGGQTRNGLAAVDLSTGNATSWNPEAGGASARVNAIHLHGDRLYVGGQYTTLGGEFRNRLGSVRAGVSAATVWDPNANGIVRTLELTADTVYVGGDFTKLGNQTQAYLAGFSLAPAFVPTSIAKALNGAFSVQFSSGDGQQVQAQFSTDLLYWETLTTYETLGQTLDLTDPDAASLPSRFYRLMLVPSE